MSRDIQNYFDNKVNNKRLEDEIIELKLKLYGSIDDVDRLEVEVTKLKSELRKAGESIDKLELKINKNWVSGVNKDTKISNLTKKVKQLTGA